MSVPLAGASSTHTAFRELPRVDVAGLYASDESLRQRAAREIGDACRDAGFFYLVGHRVDSQLVAALLLQAKRFFELPLERKLELYIGSSPNHRGYVPPGEEVFYGGARDQKEAFDLCFEPEDEAEAAAALGKNPFAGPNRWPELPGFRDAVSAYYRALFELGQTLFRGFALALGCRRASSLAW